MKYGCPILSTFFVERVGSDVVESGLAGSEGQHGSPPASPDFVFSQEIRKISQVEPSVQLVTANGVSTGIN
jgi:hypothetical protein